VGQGDVTLKDIANVVGKSVTAVSRALNDYPDIGPETKATIKQVAQDMGYKPNLMAQRLRKQRTDTLGFVLPILSPRQMDPFYSELLAGIATEATEQGFDLMVSTAASGPVELGAYRRLVEGRRVDGLIVPLPRRDDARIVYLANEVLPFVTIGQTEYEGDGFPFVWVDFATGLQRVVGHMAKQGFAKIAFIAAPQDLVFSQEGRAAFSVAMGQLKLPLNEAWVIEAGFSQKGGYQAAQRLLSMTPAPNALITCHDLVGLGAIAAVQDQGLEVGRDVAVSGLGDIPLAEHTQPPLTTIHQSTYQMGQQAVRRLAQMIAEGTFTQPDVILDSSLVIRQSSGLDLWL
jgi:LacI family transcriptional regulator